MFIDPTYGLAARTTLLTGEDLAVYEAMRKELYQRFKPVTRADCLTVEELAAVTQRIHRMRMIIDANIQIEIAYLERDNEFIDPHPALLMAKAYRNLCDKSSVLKTANRELSSLERHYNQLTKLLESRPPSSPDQALNPVPTEPGLIENVRNEPNSETPSTSVQCFRAILTAPIPRRKALAAGQPFPDFALSDRQAA